MQKILIFFEDILDDKRNYMKFNSLFDTDESFSVKIDKSEEEIMTIFEV